MSRSTIRILGFTIDPAGPFKAMYALRRSLELADTQLVRQTDNTQDRFNKTTHFTSKQGATASLTFSVECRFLPKASAGP